MLAFHLGPIIQSDALGGFSEFTEARSVPNSGDIFSIQAVHREATTPAMRTHSACASPLGLKRKDISPNWPQQLARLSNNCSELRKRCLSAKQRDPFIGLFSNSVGKSAKLTTTVSTLHSTLRTFD